MPVATAGGASFPSGHTLAVTVWVGVALLVLLPLVPDRYRRLVVGIGVALVVVVGLTRIALGVHFVSDVLGGWLIGAAWLTATATAFRAWRRNDGLSVASPGDGLAPEVGDDLTPRHAPEPAPRHPWTTAAQLLVVAVLLLGAVIGVGLLLVGLGPDSGLIRADVGVVAWLADHRTPWFDPVSAFLAELGNTMVIIAGGAVAALLAYLATRRWRPSLVIATVLVGEVLIFLASSAVVGRPRPAVPHLDGVLPPTSSFPSGHTAAATCLYGAIAALVLRGTRAWWRWIVLVAAVALVVAVGFARLYRGAHHPTDVLASVAFAIPWLLAVLRLVGDDPEVRPRPAPAKRPARSGGPADPVGREDDLACGAALLPEAVRVGGPLERKGLGHQHPQHTALDQGRQLLEAVAVRLDHHAQDVQTAVARRLDGGRRGGRGQTDHDAVRLQHVERPDGHVAADEVVDDVDRRDDLLEFCSR